MLKIPCIVLKKYLEINNLICWVLGNAVKATSFIFEEILCQARQSTVCYLKGRYLLNTWIHTHTHTRLHAGMNIQSIPVPEHTQPQHESISVFLFSTSRTTNTATTYVCRNTEYQPLFDGNGKQLP